MKVKLYTAIIEVNDEYGGCYSIPLYGKTEFNLLVNIREAIERTMEKQLEDLELNNSFSFIKYDSDFEEQEAIINFYTSNLKEHINVIRKQEVELEVDEDGRILNIIGDTINE